MKRKPKRGRPELPSDQKKAILLPVRFTKGEKLELQAMAKKDGMKFSKWVRVRLLG